MPGSEMIASRRGPEYNNAMRASLLVIGLACVLSLAGCNQQRNPDALKAAAHALEQDDCEQAVILANEALQDEPRGPRAAEALYLRGRAYEQSVAPSAAQLQANLQAARTSYVEALKRNPQRPLVDYVRASLGKVAFYQDDFQTAIQQLWIAYNDLADRELKAASLYHLAKSQQRSGQFQQADASFTTLIKYYGQTGWAQKAKELRGASNFYLQLAVYENPASFDAAARLVQQRGLRPMRLADQQGRSLLRAGPFDSYALAKQMRPKVADAFPDATIVP